MRKDNRHIGTIATSEMGYGGLGVAVFNREPMLSTEQFLAEVEAAANSRAEIARVLKLAPARVTELFKGERRLSYDEALELARAYNIEPVETVTADLLEPILRVCLRYAPKEWQDRDVQRLAEGIEYGLQLLRRASPTKPSADVIEVAAHAIADRFRQTRG